MDNVASFSLSVVSHPVQSDSRRTLHLVAGFPPRVPTGASSWPSAATLEVPDFFPTGLVVLVGQRPPTPPKYSTHFGGTLNPLVTRTARII